LWTWGFGCFGQLGHNVAENKLVLTLLAGEALGGFAAALVAAGGLHTVAVTIEGELWVWGYGRIGQLGLGDKTDRLAPTLMRAEAVFGGSPVLTVACGVYHSLVVTKDGALWTFGGGSHGELGHNDCNGRLVPAHIEAQHFGNAKMVSVASAFRHSAAVTEEGTLYTWGQASGLGHADGEAKWGPTRIAPSLLQGARVGRCHDLPPMHALTFAMGTHSRLGSCAAPTVAAGGSSQRRLQRQ